MHLSSFRKKVPGILCLAVLAIVLCIPVQAAGTGPSVPDNQVPVQQAYLAWMAEETDAEMGAAVMYVEPLPGADTSTMISLLSDFRNARPAIGSMASRPDLENLTRRMQEIATRFNEETKNQTLARGGTMKDLQVQTGNAVDRNPYVVMKKDAYWATRTTRQMEDFDLWVMQTQGTLNTLQAQGYPVAETQPYLDRFSGLKSELKSSLDSKDFDRADAAALSVRDRSLEVTGRIQDLQGQVPEDKKTGFRIDEATRVIALADRINNQLTEQILDIGAADPVLLKTKDDLRLAQGALNGGQMGLASSYLLLIKKDYNDLAAAYRDIAVSTSLPEGMADVLNTMAITLGDTADRIGGS